MNYNYAIVNNARNFIVAVASCSYPLCPLLPSTLKSGGEFAPPDYGSGAYDIAT